MYLNNLMSYLYAQPICCYCCLLPFLAIKHATKRLDRQTDRGRGGERDSRDNIRSTMLQLFTVGGRVEQEVGSVASATTRSKERAQGQQQRRRVPVEVGQLSTLIVCKWLILCTNKQTDKRTGRQTVRETDRQRNKQTEGRTD